jgi:hypothetical protein
MAASREIPTRYLSRVWPETDEPPPLSPSEMWCPESLTEGDAANDRAITRALRNWAQQRANTDAQPYTYEISRYTTVGSLDPSVQTRQVLSPLARDTVHPAGHTPSPTPVTRA